MSLRKKILKNKTFFNMVEKDYNGVKLLVPLEFAKADIVLLKKICNGCGPGGWKYDLVPDKIGTFEIKPACQPHDWMFGFGRKTKKCFKFCNLVFKYNLKQLNKQTKSFWRSYLLNPLIILLYVRGVSNKIALSYFFNTKL